MKGISHCLSDAEVVALAEMAHGHVGGDLKAVCLEGGEGNEQGCSETYLSLDLSLAQLVALDRYLGPHLREMVPTSADSYPPPPLSSLLERAVQQVCGRLREGPQTGEVREVDNTRTEQGGVRSSQHTSLLRLCSQRRCSTVPEQLRLLSFF